MIQYLNIYSSKNQYNSLTYSLILVTLIILIPTLNKANVFYNILSCSDSTLFLRKQNTLFIPFVLFNSYDKFQPAILFASKEGLNYLEKFYIIPSYSFKNQNFNSHFYIKSKPLPVFYNIFNDYEFNFRNFSYFLKGDTALRYSVFILNSGLIFKQKNSKIRFSILPIFLKFDKLKWINNINNYEITKKQAFFLKFESCFEHFSQTRTKYSTTLALETYSKYIRTYLIEQIFLKYKHNDKGLKLRFFVGYFLNKNLPSIIDGRFRLSGIAGIYDYKFENTYLSRSEYSYNILANQIYEGDGFFKTRIPIGQTWNWLTTISFVIDFPQYLPLQFYCEIGTYAEAFKYKQFELFPYNAGITLIVWKDVLTFYLPIITSKDIINFYELNNINILNRITWSFNPNNINIRLR